MNYFTADTHFGDKRLNLYHRDLLFEDVNLMDNYMKFRWNAWIRPDDTVYHLGDVAVSEEGLEIVKELNGKKILILGNYDEEFNKKGLLKEYFDEILGSKLMTINGQDVYLNHYPTEIQPNMFNIVGHIHGLWQVQRNTINVGVDAWSYTPVSEELIIWKMNAIKKYYDENVFAGELESNLEHSPKKVLKKIKKFLDEKLK